jgi:uncharacterized membrane protein YbjE (DUF340 family)
VKLPELLASVNMEEDALNKLQQKLLDILKYASFLITPILCFPLVELSHLQQMCFVCNHSTSYGIFPADSLLD